jgi:type I restriction-modification system DNA methylase subunit
MDIQKLKETDRIFRQFGIEGEETFKLITSHYLNAHKPQKVSKCLADLWREGNLLFDTVKSDKIACQTLAFISANDYYGESLPIVYQYFLTKRFRYLSGKFFTPRNLANLMTSMLPLKKDAIIMDPTCGGGTFLIEAAKRWQNIPCTLVGNDIDKLLLCLTETIVLINKYSEHDLIMHNENIYNVYADMKQLSGKVDCILANPPFSLSIESFNNQSKLFNAGYRNSDALFIDLAYNFLKPGGYLVCLLPHSIIANKEYKSLRTIIEEDWELTSVITMPEGTFNLTSNTTTRADIICMRKRGGERVAGKIVFGNISNVEHLNFNRNELLNHYDELSHLFEDLQIGYEGIK